MSRIRSIKPEFFSSAQIADCSTNARLLFIGMWCFCDDAGRHPDNPRELKMRIFPGDDIDSSSVRRMVDELVVAGLMIRYVVDGKGYLQVTGWHHQKIDRPQKPKYPAPDEADGTVIDDDSSNDRRALATDPTRSDPIRSDPRQREADSTNGTRDPPRSRGSRLAADWSLPDDWLAESRAKHIGTSETFFRREAERFRNYWVAKPGKDGLKLDWKATWANWVITAMDRSPGNARASPNGAHGKPRNTLQAADLLSEEAKSDATASAPRI